MTTSKSFPVLMPRVTIALSAVPSAGDGNYRVFLAYERRVSKMGTGRCDITDGILPSDAADFAGGVKLDSPGIAAPYKQINSSTPLVAGKPTISYPMPYGIYTVCVDNITKGKRLNTAYRVDNVPPGAPFYTQGRDKIITKSQIDSGDNGCCSQDGAAWPRLSEALTNP